MQIINPTSTLEHPASHAADEATRTDRTGRSPLDVIARAVFSFPALLGALLVAAPFVSLRNFTLDSDIWWHLKVGQAILAMHHWPSADTYSFAAPGTPWMANEWIGEVLLAATHQAFGLQGLLALNLALGGAILLALYGLASLRSGNSKAAFVACAVLVFLTAVLFTLRPQMLGYLFLIITLIILERFRLGRARTLWLLPALFLLWVNTHGSFVFGIFAFGVYVVSGLVKIRWGGLESVPWTAGERLRLGSVFLASLIALAITPYGIRLAGFPLEMAYSHPMVAANIQEWQPMPFNTQTGKLFLALLIGFLLAQAILRFTWHLAEYALFLFGIIAACLHARFVMVFVPFCAPPLAVILKRWLAPYEPRKDKYGLNAILMVGVIVAMVRFFPSRAQLERRVAQQWPVKAVQYLQQHPPARPMFNNYEYGGYLIYALDDQNKVFIDGRTDMYEHSGVFSDYLRIGRATPDALLLLQKYNVQSCLIGREEALATILAASSQWQRAYSDDLCVLFVRQGVRGLGVASR